MDNSIDIKSDYIKIFILTTFTNILYLYFINYNSISSFVYLNSLSINLIMFNDIYFEIKHKNYRINFNIMPKYYPSYRKFFNNLYYINSICIFGGISKICYDFWMNEFIDFITFNKPYEHTIKLIVITIMTNILSIILLIITIHFSIKYVSLFLETMKIVIFNYINEQPLFYNVTKEEDYYCWVCEKNISKYKVVKKLNCPCQEHFHPDCIDKYLNLYNNYCRAGHRIAKYEHTV